MKQLQNFSFGQAIDFMKMGYKVSRKGWDKDMYIGLSDPEINLMTEKFICVTTIENNKVRSVPWVATQSDLLSEDWRMPL